MFSNCNFTWKASSQELLLCGTDVDASLNAALLTSSSQESMIIISDHLFIFISHTSFNSSWNLYWVNKASTHAHKKGFLEFSLWPNKTSVFNIKFLTSFIYDIYIRVMKPLKILSLVEILRQPIPHNSSKVDSICNTREKLYLLYMFIFKVLCMCDYHEFSCSFRNWSYDYRQWLWYGYNLILN